MGVLRECFRFYINSSIHVALAVLAFTASTCMILGVPAETDVLGFIFFGTITGYNFVKYAGIAQLHHRSLTSTLKTIQLFSLLSFVACVYFVFQIKWTIVLACVPLGLLTFFYAVPLFPSAKNLRTTPTLKVFVIAGVWAGTTVYLPKVAANLDWTVEILVLLVQRFLIVLALIVPFEIRDLAFDAKNLATLPQLLGVKQTKMIGYFLLLVALGSNLMGSYSTNWIFLGFQLPVTALAIYCSGKDQNSYYASFWVEGIPVVSWFLLMLFT
ncbi:hypothetical protein [Flavimarina sp. Hel_I_48]|uniref:hypothetical protein n=1 Tax=Flavimarina sp. Hel_I_48 TaxID=1392488 RepID=UPI0004DF0C4A|nr:hypothetical protein [Flavimarina sp. Hel_I_48]